MNIRRRYFSMFAIAALVTASTTMVASAATGDAKAVVGEVAPNFTLADASGKEISLSDYKGKIVVLQWINPDCPVCVRVSTTGLVKKMVKQIKAIDKDVVHLTINSTHYMDAETSAKYLKSHKITAPALIDTDGTVGHIYGAKTTPHMFVIDTEGVLRYEGAFDNDSNGKNKGKATNYVINAVRQITEGETVTPDRTKSYGCSVKYDPK